MDPLPPSASPATDSEPAAAQPADNKAKAELAGELSEPRGDVEESLRFTFWISGPRRVPDAPPIWYVEAEMLMWSTTTHGLEDGWYSRALRSLYVSTIPAPVLPALPRPTLLPGTMIARCRIYRAHLTVNGVAVVFEPPRGTHVDATLVLQSEEENNDWSGDVVRQLPLGQKEVRYTFNRAVCVGGQIPFGAFAQVPPPRPTDPTAWQVWFSRDFLREVSNPILSSSGLAIDAKAVLGWGPPPTAVTVVETAPYLVEVVLERGVDGKQIAPLRTGQPPPLVVLPDLERLADDRYAAGRAGLLGAFSALARLVSPNPEDGGAGPLHGRLRWLNLEPPDPGKMPPFHWEVTKLPAQSATNRLVFEPGAWTLRLSDQPLGLPGVTPLGVLSASPEVSVERSGDTSKIQIKVRPPGEPRASDPPTPSFHYTAAIVTPPAPAGPGPAPVALGTEYSESITLENFRASYDAAGQARFLRERTGLPEPGLDKPPAEVLDADADADLDPSVLLSGLTLTAPLRDGMVDSPVLYGFLPAEDGWVQLPFLNVTEQILFDSFTQAAAGSTIVGDSLELPTSPVGGAVSFGTEGDGLYDPTSGEVAWGITLLGASTYLGTWTLTPTADHTAFQLHDVDLSFQDPDLKIRGLLSLATAPPTTADALPTFDNWLGALAPMDLRTFDPADPFASPFRVDIPSLIFRRDDVTTDPEIATSAVLRDWSFKYVANVPAPSPSPTPTPTPIPTPTPTPSSVYERLFRGSRYDADRFWATPPLAWRRQGRTPMIQALPMTQNAVPPNNPSASRQLYPFLLPVKPLLPSGLPAPFGWEFRATGAASWPTLVTAVNPAVGGNGLGLVSLCHPGLVFNRDTPPGLFSNVGAGDDFLPAQYRHDLPVLDEVNALATLPKDDDPSKDGDSPPVQPSPLRPEDYGDYWAHLSDLAFFASADASEALAAGVVRGVVEPLDWPATAMFSARAYPGSLSFVDPNGRTVLLAGAGRGHEALRGIEGTFHLRTDGRIELTDPADAATADFTVVGGSMLAALRATTGRLRDQRGLERGATEIVATAGVSMLRTRVSLADDPGPAAATVDLWTTSAPITLNPTSVDAWTLWFRDLPAVESAGSSTFDRSRSDSSQRRGINNPAALSRERIALNGYEWRLGDGSNARSLKLGPHRFFPLSIEKAVFDSAGRLQSVELIGRLHLPVSGDPNPPEPDTRANAVRLSFGPSGALTSRITAAPGDFDGPALPGTPPARNEWPLADEPGAPSLRWSEIEVDNTAGQFTLNAVLEYRSHGVSWTLKDHQLVIPFTGPIATVTYDPIDFKSDDNAAVSVISGTLTLDPGGHHEFQVTWQFAWGNPTELQLVAKSVDVILGPNPGPGEPSASLRHQNQSFGLRLDRSGGADILRPNLDGKAVQIQWSGVDPVPADLTTFQVLPGFHLADASSQPTRGYGLLAFSLEDQPGDVPKLSPKSGRVESIFGCRWGNSLQDLAPSTGESPTIDKHIFGSSFGRIDAAYTSGFDPAATNPARPWSTHLLLNGVLEVKSLVSWPDLMQVTPADGDINLATLPASQPVRGTPPPLSHLRHTIRILLNQHATQPGVVQSSAQPKIFLQIREGQVWTTRAAVEHQLVWIDMETPGTTKVGADVRFTLVQEIRFSPPATFIAALRAVNPADGLATLDPSTATPDRFNPARQEATVSVDRLPAIARGYFGATMIDRLAGDGGALRDASGAILNDLMLIEASVPAYLATWAAEKVATPSNLAYLPGGTTRALLSTLTDFQTPPPSAARSNPSPPAKTTAKAVAAPPAEAVWLLLLLPFLGRSQPIEQDGLDPVIAAAPSPPSAKPGPAKSGPAKPVAAVPRGDVRIDPVNQIQRAQANNTSPISRLALTLANREDAAAVSIGLAEFDLARNRTFTRLDPSSVRESWFRLSLSPPAAAVSDDKDLAPVLANAPTDDPGTLGRPESLDRVYDPFRFALPPRAPKSFNRTAAAPAAPAFSAPIRWEPGSLLLIDTASLNRPRPERSAAVLGEFGFLGTGFMLQQAGLVRREADPSENGPGYRAGASLMPPRLVPDRDRGPNPQPVSLAVSPYLGLDFEEAGPPPAETDNWLLGLSELVVFDTTGAAAVSLATRFWYPPKFPETGHDAYALIRAWARDTWSRFAADSPVAVVRLREIYPTRDGSGVVVNYRFLSPEAVVAPPSPARRSFALRPEPAALRFAQGQFGGTVMPLGSLSAIELAPPQVSGVQPIRLDGRPGADWPWGLSAIRVSLRQTEGRDGLAGPAITEGEGRVWWQSLAHGVQYAVPEDPGGRQILPRMFRARAMAGMLPNWAQTPLPSTADVHAALAPRDGDGAPAAATVAETAWQPVLPGGYTVTLSGLRPGVPFAFREQIQTHDLASGQVVQSGTLPVMHRAPRPVVFGSNSKLRVDYALQPWQGAFDPTVNVSIGEDPADNAFLADGSTLTGLKNDGTPATFYELSLVLRDRYDLLLMPGLATIADLPQRRSRLVVIAEVGGLPFVRIFDTDIDPPTDLNKTTSPDKADDLDRLSERMAALAGSQPLPGIQQLALLNAVTAIRNAPNAGPVIGLGSINFGVISLNDGDQRPGTGDLVFRASARKAVGGIANPATDTDPTKWTLSAELTDGTSTFSYPNSPLANGQVVFKGNLKDPALAWLTKLPHAAPLTVRIHAAHTDAASTVNGYSQTLTFPVRVDRGGHTFRIPYRPAFALFEDPEYNRRLAGSSAQKSGLVTVTVSPPAPAHPTSVSVTLAADRREYNTTGTINYVYFGDPAQPGADLLPATGQVAIKLVRNDPLSGPLASLTLKTVDVTRGTLAATPDNDLATLCSGTNTRLQPGDTLLLQLMLQGFGSTPIVELAVSIVARPVTPAPDAGYALLRREPDGAVDCARFAFSPMPARVELIDPSDLLQQVVRRRAVFRWIDSVRSTQPLLYAIQKTTVFGSTHFPDVPKATGPR